MNALVADAKINVALPVIRSLGKKEVDVVVASDNEKSYSHHSKYTKGRIIYPKLENDYMYIEKFLNLIEKHCFDVLLPTINKDVLRELSKNKKRFEKYCNLPIADYESFDKADNKAETLRIAVEKDIPTMSFFTSRNPDDIDSFSTELNFPLVIKPCCLM